MAQGGQRLLSYFNIDRDNPVAAAGAAFLARTALIMEVIALRHQVAVLQRNRTRRPCFRASDRLLWVLFSRWWQGWRESLIIVQSETVLRWRLRVCR
jgi:hypothetical protein